MKNNIGVFIGRFCPIHLGHEAVIREMISIHKENSLLIICSSNQKMSMRNFFSYEERRIFIKKIFPNLSIVGLPDYQSSGGDNEWLLALDDIISLTGINPEQTIFFCGCQEDIDFFLKAGRRHYIINRFSGKTPKISATEVRDSLNLNRNLDGLLNPNIKEDVKKCFNNKWKLFKKI